MAQQTAVGWIEDNIQSDMTFMEIMGLIRQAKTMEKEQIKESYVSGWLTALNNTIDGNSKFKNCEQYYNETYNK